MSFKDYLNESEIVDQELTEAYVKSQGYKTTDSAIDMLYRQLNEHSNLMKRLIENGCATPAQAKAIGVAMDKVEKIWSKIDNTVSNQ